MKKYILKRYLKMELQKLREVKKQLKKERVKK